jgi:hypothetical protein
MDTSTASSTVENGSSLREVLKSRGILPADRPRVKVTRDQDCLAGLTESSFIMQLEIGPRDRFDRTRSKPLTGREIDLSSRGRGGICRVPGAGGADAASLTGFSARAIVNGAAETDRGSPFSRENGDDQG